MDPTRASYRSPPHGPQD